MMTSAQSDLLDPTPNSSRPRKSAAGRWRIYFGKQLLALLALPLAGTLSAAVLKPQPVGIYDLVFDPEHNAGVDLNLSPVLDNPNVDGYRFRVDWKGIQPDNGNEYHWESLDAAIAVAAAHGKKMCISVAAGLYTPDWVYTIPPVVYKYVMLETDPLTGLSIGNQPLPWDTAYQTKWKKFLAAFGAKYDSNPTCSYVVLGGFMEQFNLYLASITEDATAMENLAKNPPAGYPGLTTSYPDFSAAYTPAAEGIIASYATNFPTTCILLTLTPVIPGDVGTTLQGTVSNWGKTTYLFQFGTMVSALYATPAPHDPPAPPVSNPKGFQMVCSAISDPARLYLDPDPVPIPNAPIPLQDALERAVSLGASYVELYEGDLTPVESQSVLAAERVKLQANVSDRIPPPPPTPPETPTGLHVL